MTLIGAMRMTEENKDKFDNRPDEVPEEDIELFDEDSDALESFGATFSSARKEWDFNHKDLNEAAKNLFNF